MQSGARLGFGALRQLVQAVGGGGRARQALNTLKQIMPAGQMASPAINQATRRAAVNLGLADELTAFPSAVSARGGNLGVIGTRNVPTARELGQAPVPQWGAGSRTPSAPAGSRPVNQLQPQPYQGPRTRGGDIVPTSSPAGATTPTRTQFTEDLISTPVSQGPARAPMQGPSMTGTPVQGQLDLRFGPGSQAATQFTTGRGAVRPAGTNIAGQPYRGGPVATERNLETLAINRAASEPLEQVTARAPQGQGSFFLDNAPDVWTGGYRMRPELTQQLPAEVQRRIGTMMMRETVDAGPVAPPPAFGIGAGPAPVDALTDMAFKRGAAAGNELVDLGALLNDPKIRAMIGLGGAGAFAAGMAGMMGDRDRTGETTAGSPPNVPGTTPPALFLENDGTPLGTSPGVAPSVVAPATTNIDPVVSAPVVTTGGVQAGSAVREALAQSSPAAAAVLRAVEPMSPEKYRSIEEYTAARQAFAQAKPEIRELMRYMETQSPTAGGGLAMWAYSNQDLARNYQAQQQALKNPAMSQQGAESVTTQVLTAPIGSQNEATAPYNAAITAEAVTGGGQGAQMLKEVTSPQPQPYLQRTQDFIQRQAPRAAMYAGY